MNTSPEHTFGQNPLCIGGVFRYIEDFIKCPHVMTDLLWHFVL